MRIKEARVHAAANTCFISRAAGQQECAVQQRRPTGPPPQAGFPTLEPFPPFPSISSGPAPLSLPPSTHLPRYLLPCYKST